MNPPSQLLCYALLTHVLIAPPLAIWLALKINREDKRLRNLYMREE
jgi:isoprenylcysteine carboxyl methyltransferase (ICMT) family protein YpbQ